MAHYYCISKKLTIYHCFENMKRYLSFLKLEFVKFEFTIKVEFKKPEFF